MKKCGTRISCEYKFATSSVRKRSQNQTLNLATLGPVFNSKRAQDMTADESKAEISSMEDDEEFKDSGSESDWSDEMPTISSKEVGSLKLQEPPSLDSNSSEVSMASNSRSPNPQDIPSNKFQQEPKKDLAILYPFVSKFNLLGHATGLSEMGSATVKPLQLR
jgi:hypothetical protein